MCYTFTVVKWLIIAALYIAVSPASKPDNRPSVTEQKSHSQTQPSTIAFIDNKTCAPDQEYRQNASPQSYAALKSPEWWLVVLGFPTLFFIAWQVIETRRTAKATLRYVEAVIEGQRPIIAAAMVGNPTKELHDRDAPRIRIALSNKGITTAYEVTYQSWIELLPFPFADFTGAADHFASENPCSIYPHYDPIILNIPIRNGLSEAQLKDLRELRLYACVRICVTFRDAFSPSRYSNFGFYVMSDGMGWLPKYNDSN